MGLAIDGHKITGLALGGQSFISAEKVGNTDALIGKEIAIPSGTDINYFVGGSVSTPSYSTGKISYVIRDIYNPQNNDFTLYVFNTYDDATRVWSPAWVRANVVTVIGGGN